MSAHNAVQLNIDEVKDLLVHIINNNRKLQEQKKPSVSTEVIGDSGIGKTSTILQLANEMGLNYVKLNLAQIEELGDLVGYPIRQFEMVKNKGTEEAPEWVSNWVDEHLLEDARHRGYIASGKSQMSYCAPEWIANKKGGGILILDDWNRKIFKEKLVF